SVARWRLSNRARAGSSVLMGARFCRPGAELAKSVGYAGGCLVAAASPAGDTRPGRRKGWEMDAERNKDVARQYYVRVLNDGDIDLLDELAVEGYEEHDPLPGQGTGRQGLKDRASAIRDAFGQTFTIEDVVAEGDRVVVRWT